MNCAQTKPEHRKQERMSVMRRKRTGGKNSAYRREKAIMTASVVLVLAAMTVTGISVYRNHQKSQEEEQHIVDFSKLEKETQSPVSQAQNPSAQNVTGSDKDSGELDYDPYYAQKDKDLSAPAKTGGESGAGAAREQETGSQRRSPKIATSAMQSIETKRTTATEVRANWHPAAVRRMRQTLTKKRTEQPRVRMQPTIRTRRLQRLRISQCRRASCPLAKAVSWHGRLQATFC